MGYFSQISFIYVILVHLFEYRNGLKRRFHHDQLTALIVFPSLVSLQVPSGRYTSLPLIQMEHRRHQIAVTEHILIL